MAQFTIEDLISTTGGVMVTQVKPWGQPVSLSTDTRTIGPGNFFVPLTGERFDGHTYLEQAFGQGAQGAFVAREQWQQHPEWQNFPNLIAVMDPLMAYLAMARLHRQHINPKVIAVTGSSGKTTTKEMLFTALSGVAPTQKSEKNFNNEVGLCQTLLALQPGTQWLIVEMGMRGLDQISLLSQYALPDIGVVVNVGPAHIGLLGSLENIAKAKCEIFTGMNPASAVGVVNGDDALLLQTAQKAWNGKLVAYRLSEAKNIQPTPEGGIEFQYGDERIQLVLPGQHNVSNALAVLKVGESLGVPLTALAQGLRTFQPQDGRWEKTPLQGFTNGWVINDAYNANPASVRASLQAFLEIPSPGLKRILVLGGMKELGDLSQHYHEELAQWLSRQTGIHALYTVGEEGQWIADAMANAAFPVFHGASNQEISEQIHREGLSLDHTILFLKGSRAFKLEQIPEALLCEGRGV